MKKKKPKQWETRFAQSYVLDGYVEAILETAELEAGEAKPHRREKLHERMAEVRTAYRTADIDKVGAACFQLGIELASVAKLKGKLADPKEVAFVHRIRARRGDGVTNREIQRIVEAQRKKNGERRFPQRTEKDFDKWMRRNVRSRGVKASAR